MDKGLQKTNPPPYLNHLLKLFNGMTIFIVNTHLLSRLLSP